MPGGPASTGQQRCWRQRAAAPRGRVRRLEQRDERGAVRLEQQVGADQASAADRGVLAVATASGCSLSHGDGQPEQAVVRLGVGARAAAAAASGGARSGRPAAPAASSSGSTSSPPATVAAGRVDRLGQGERGQRDLAARPPRPSVSTVAPSTVERGDRSYWPPSASALHLAHLQLEEAQVDGDRRRSARRGREQALHRHAGLLAEARRAAAAAGPSTPNCQRDWFLLRAGPVGVEQVALVEHRVGDRRGRVDVEAPVTATTSSRPASSVRDRLVPADQPVPGAVVGEPRERRRGRAGSSRCSGSRTSIICRHTATGMS